MLRILKLLMSLYPLLIEASYQVSARSQVVFGVYFLVRIVKKIIASRLTEFPGCIESLRPIADPATGFDQFAVGLITQSQTISEIEVEEVFHVSVSLVDRSIIA
jgi:hypothetical protein